MTRDDVLSDLRTLEAKLRSAEVQALYRTRSGEERRHFAARRTELSLLIERLTTAEIDRTTAGLEELGDELGRSMRTMRSRLAALDRPAATLNALARLLGIVARLAVLAG